MINKKLLLKYPQFRRFYSFLTSDLYPEVKRGPFGVLNSSHIQTFESLLSKDRVITDKDELIAYNKDWLNMVCGQSSVALKPKTTEEVSEIMKICYNEHLAVCPQGGNTGVVGGSVPVFDEVIVSLSLMNKIHQIDADGGTVRCDAGCVLEQLDSQVAKKGLMMPLDLGAKGTCQIGGNIATCAGGLRLIRYGSIAANLLGLEIVLANGEVLSMMNHMKKDNTGYHLKNLFIGSEGTLGVITGAVIHCPPRPKSVTLAFLGLDSYENVLKTFRCAKNHLSETLSSCEMMDAESMVSVMRLGLNCPIKQNRFYMIIETHGSNSSHDEEKMAAFITEVIDSRVVTDGTFTSQPSSMLNLWQLRERIPESVVRFGHMYTYDISLPLSHFYEVVYETRKRLSKHGYSTLPVFGCGHIGDGNLHILIEGPSYEDEVTNILEPWLFEWTVRHGGSMSAEHGLGFKKRKYIGLGKSSSVVDMMLSLKKQIDPTGILNPYKVI
ncbi:D-2-hydroxyglutarate dehydrogenase, mitochondrial isoform X2 [Halyomorpha halys]|nr:D-2-hydroxyglutarate dehydrogenase, mitochondrial isoform X2 [Halyomorpha halys]